MVQITKYPKLRRQRLPVSHNNKPTTQWVLGSAVLLIRERMMSFTGRRPRGSRETQRAEQLSSLRCHSPVQCCLNMIRQGSTVKRLKAQSSGRRRFRHGDFPSPSCSSSFTLPEAALLHLRWKRRSGYLAKGGRRGENRQAGTKAVQRVCVIHFRGEE